MIPRAGTPPRRGVTYRRRPGVYAMLVLGDRILLTHQSHPRSETQLPGGGVDPGETQLSALHREVLEETGWTITAPRRVGAYRRFTFMPEYNIWAEKLCHVYVARPALRRGEPSELHHRAEWTTLETALNHLNTPGDREFVATLRDVMRKQGAQ